MNILSKNEKTKYSLNMPRTTCLTKCPFFKKTCYARKGRFVFKPTIQANNARLALYKSNPLEYFDRLEIELQALIDKKIHHIRIFGIGDFPDNEFASMLADTCKKFPDMNFWIATFKGRYMELPKFPDNVVVRYSMQSNALRNRAIEAGEAVSNVIEDVNSLSNGSIICPATSKTVKTCQECGHICWKKDLKHVAYIKH
jgi:hypothetical protein